MGEWNVDGGITVAGSTIMSKLRMIWRRVYSGDKCEDKSELMNHGRRNKDYEQIKDCQIVDKYNLTDGKSPV